MFELTGTSTSTSTYSRRCPVWFGPILLLRISVMILKLWITLGADLSHRTYFTSDPAKRIVKESSPIWSVYYQSSKIINRWMTRWVWFDCRCHPPRWMTIFSSSCRLWDGWSMLRIISVGLALLAVLTEARKTPTRTLNNLVFWWMNFLDVWIISKNSDYWLDSN